MLAAPPRTWRLVVGAPEDPSCRLLAVSVPPLLPTEIWAPPAPALMPPEMFEVNVAAPPSAIFRIALVVPPPPKTDESMVVLLMSRALKPSTIMLPEPLGPAV